MIKEIFEYFGLSIENKYYAVIENDIKTNNNKILIDGYYIYFKKHNKEHYYKIVIYKDGKMFIVQKSSGPKLSFSDNSHLFAVDNTTLISKIKQIYKSLKTKTLFYPTMENCQYFLIKCNVESFFTNNILDFLEINFSKTIDFKACDEKIVNGIVHGMKSLFCNNTCVEIKRFHWNGRILK